MIQLGTKAETLKRLQNRLVYAKVLPQVCFSVKDWKCFHKNFYARCIDTWGEKTLIIRSSAINEDTQESSQAGKFESVADVHSEQEFCNAVNTVIASFDDDNENNQILVQPLLKNVRSSGVAFTLDPNSLGNYYVINYDESGSTFSVTSGNGQEGKLLYVFKGKEQNIGPSYIDRLCHVLRELEELFGCNNLDVEFAVTGEDELYILQVRALCINGGR